MSGHQAKCQSVQGSLPCGNPRRYMGRDVVRMSKESNRGVKRSAKDVDDSLKTQGELHLQHLLQKQINTDVTLAGQFSEHRTFSEATEHCPSVNKLVGVHGYHEYRQIKDLDSKIDSLRHYGLDEEEIALKLRQDMGADVKGSSKLSGYGADPAVEARMLQAIDKKIEEKERQLRQPHATKGALLLTRKEMEVELAHRQRYGHDDGDEEPMSKASSSLLVKSKLLEPAMSHPDDPINHIPDMIVGLEGRDAAEREPRRDRRRRRKIEQRMQYYQQFEAKACQDVVSIGVEATDALSSSGEANHSETSVIDSGETYCPVNTAASQDELPLSSNEEEDLVEATCAPRPPGWVSTKPTKRKKRPSRPPADDVKMRPDVVFKSREELTANRLSLDEIKELPKFLAYSPGVPNKILYLKNLSSQTSVSDLMELFGCVQQDEQPRVTFKLLTGRMKGQAFVTFHDEDTAIEALSLVNGYILHGSPVIVSYGKKT